MMQPRNDQKEMLSRLEWAWQEGASVLLRCPKEIQQNTVAETVIRQELNKAGEGPRPKILMTTGRQEDASRCADLLKETRIDYAMYEPDSQEPDNQEPDSQDPLAEKDVVIAGIDTLTQAVQAASETFQPALILFCEVSAADLPELEALRALWPQARLLGLLADKTEADPQQSEAFARFFATRILTWYANKEDIALISALAGNPLLSDEATGLQVYAGKKFLGVRKNGLAVCPAKYTRIDLLGLPGYFAIATYRDADRKERRTLIDKNGTDLQAPMCNSVYYIGDGIFQYASTLPYPKACYFDTVSKAVYEQRPEMVMIAGLQFVVLPNKRYMLRSAIVKTRKACMGTFLPASIYHNGTVIILESVLMIPHATPQFYDVYGYYDNQIAVFAPNGATYYLVNLDGTIATKKMLPDKDWQRQPLLGELFERKGLLKKLT